MANPFGRTDEQQKVEELHARIGAQNKEIRMLKAALNNRDIDIKQLKANAQAAAEAMRDTIVSRLDAFSSDDGDVETCRTVKDFADEFRALAPMAGEQKRRL